MFATKNIELNHEFYFASPFLKFRINEIYNTHYTGSPLWNLFSDEAMKFESCYNKAGKIMFHLPLATHSYFIELVTGHILRIILVSRF